MTLRDRQILHLALPSIVSNITVPLLGLVDVAIVGHMGNAVYIGAVSVGSMIFNTIYWLFGFLRMGTSGMTSQALGRRKLGTVSQLLVRSLAVALAIALVLILLQVPIKRIAMFLVEPEVEIETLASDYFNICVWGAPAMLSLYALCGWMVGMQNTRLPMIVSITQNVVNIMASICLVYGFKMKIEGVAWGTVIAQYVGVLVAVLVICRCYGRLGKYLKWKGLFGKRKMFDFFKLNTDIFFRTVCLVAVNLFFLSFGARQGSLILAVNTLLVQLYILFSYFLDGFAFAGEAICGKYYGASNNAAFQETVRRVFVWGAFVALFFTCIYLFGGLHFLNLLTDQKEVVERAADFYYWAVAVPLVGVSAFVWDGVFIGITASRGMLLSSVAATLSFFICFGAMQGLYGNHALWIAFLLFLAVRGIVQTFIFIKCYNK